MNQKKSFILFDGLMLFFNCKRKSVTETNNRRAISILNGWQFENWSWFYLHVLIVEVFDFNFFFPQLYENCRLQVWSCEKYHVVIFPEILWYSKFKTKFETILRHLNPQKKDNCNLQWLFYLNFLKLYVFIEKSDRKL